MRSTALRTASAPAPSVLACRFSTYSPEKSGFTSAPKMQLRHQKGKWHYQTKQTVGASLEFFNNLPKEPAIKFVLIRSRNARSACGRPARLRRHFHVSYGVAGFFGAAALGAAAFGPALFAAAAFAFPCAAPPLLSQVSASLALNGNWLTDCSQVVLIVT